MIEANPHLAICVPTYNRPEALDRCLALLVAQCGPARVAICVSDNASDTDVAAIVERHQVLHPWIRFRRNESNLGMGANFIRVLELCEARYAWLFSDDDAMSPGAIEAMLARCATPDAPELLIANRKYMRQDMAEDRGVCSESMDADLLLSGGGLLLERAAVRHYTFIGCLCFRADLWRRCRPERFLHLPYFPHLSIVASFMADSAHRALIIAEPLALVRGGGFSWEKRAGIVWFRDLATCVRASEGYTDTDRRAALRAAWRDINPYTLWLVCKHGKRRETIAAWWQSLGDHAALSAWGLWLFNGVAVCATLLTPQWFWNAGRLAYRALSPSQRST